MRSEGGDGPDGEGDHKTGWGQTPATKETTNEDGKIEHRRGGKNKPMMMNGGDRGDSNGESILTARVTQPADDEE